MKVLLVNKFFFINGGSEAVFFQERDYFRKTGVVVVDFSMYDERNIESPYADFFVRLRQYRGNSGILRKISAASSFVHSPEAVKKFSALILAERPDIVHCHNIYHQLTPSIIGAAKKLGVPVVLTLHDYKPVCPIYVRIRDGQPCSDCLEGDFFNVVKHRCADRSLGKSVLLYAEAVFQRWMGNYELVDKVIAPSQFMADSVISRFPREKIEVIYNGVDTDIMLPSEEDAGYVLYLGRLSKEKGVATLISAYRQYNIRMPLKVCGTGPLLDELSGEQLPNVAFLGYQSGAALRSIIRKASIICVPSEWYENCPMSVLEAMAYGKPVVGARMGGIPELVDEGVTGVLHEKGDVSGLAQAINVLANDKVMRRRMGRAARKRVEEKFSLAKHNEALLSVYKSLIH